MNNEVELNKKEQNKQYKSKKLKDAYNNFKKISNNPINNKLEQLPNWLYKASNLLLRENKNEKGKILKLKRGSIIIVDFGVGIGSEISNPHFAIVLTKNDTPYNKTLTILPLSSKNTKYNYPLDKLIFNEFLKKFNQVRKELLIESSNARKELNKIPYKEIPMKIMKPNNLTDNDIKNIEKYMEINEIYKELIIKKRKIEKVIQFYKKHKKNTYACINQITTISKERLYNPINEYDIVGTSKCSDEILDKIDELIIENYTNYTIDNINKKEEKELTFS